MDATDNLAPLRARFALPADVIYLDGNSLGPLPLATRAHLHHVVDSEWGDQLIRSWGTGWMEAPARIGGKIAPLIGAAAHEVIVADSTSVNLFKVLAAAVAMRPGRHKILLESDNFPTDRHVAEGLARLAPWLAVCAVPPQSLMGSMDDDTAAVLLCHVHYRSGARHDMAELTAAAQAAGALTVWDVSHSVGAIAVNLTLAQADFAVGCGYKFLNGGPGAPAFIYAAQRHHEAAAPPLQGWIGHADPFSFSDRHVAAPGIARFLTGTPGILGLAALESAVDLCAGVDQAALSRKSAAMFDIFADICGSMNLLTPRDAELRGSHIAFSHPQAAAIMAQLIRQGIIGDYRPPDILRFGLTPLYTTYAEIWRAATTLAELL